MTPHGAATPRSETKILLAVENEAALRELGAQLSCAEIAAPVVGRLALLK